jgi:hypothetical protein
MDTILKGSFELIISRNIRLDKKKKKYLRSGLRRFKGSETVPMQGRGE